MNIRKLVISGLLVVSFFSHTASAQNNRARIKIDIERQIGAVDKNIYSSFTEHLGRCIYGGIYEAGSPLSDEDGFRKDVLEAVKELKVPLVRWPGGNFVSGYHWEDGIGPKNQRPTRMELAWHATESNAFGTDEFMKWCRKANVEPYFCINLGTGSLDEARNWVEYCNVEKGTYYSDLRIKNGNTQPYKVTYWGLGNEMDGYWQMGQKNVDDYGKYALEAAKLMKWIDKDIKLIAAGSSDYGRGWINWNRTVLDYLKDHADYISLHQYVGYGRNNYYDFMAATRSTENIIRITEGLIRETMTKTRRKTPIYIAFDEYNVYKEYLNGVVEEKFNLEDALVIATYLNVFVRNAHIVKMANQTLLVNTVAPIVISKEGLWYQTIFYPLALFAGHCHGQSLQVFTDCETYKSGNDAVPYLDVSSTYNEEKKEIVINVVNRHKEQAIATDILCQTGAFSGKAQLYEVNGKDIKDENSAKEQLVKVQNKDLSVKGDKFAYSFPAHSFTQLRVPVTTPR
ncbi:alpha-L-arabinofuranosidase [Candidatus Symbiothrix dinenymphae]|nr:alpha-L-arabinofuranosidase [Candidatus Symbiothrix dinenymphae]